MQEERKLPKGPQPIDWTGIRELHARSQGDIKKDGTLVFPKKVGRPSTGFDKKRYDRERIARIRAQAKLTSIPKP